MKEYINKKGLFLIIVLLGILIALLAYGYLSDKQLQKSNREDYLEWYENRDTKDQPKNEGDVLNNGTNTPKELNEDVYSKLKNKKDVKIVVLGDGLALSVGRNSDAGIWQSGVENIIKTKYGSKVQITSLAKNKTSAKDGLDVVAKNNMKEYDMAIICYGHNDSNSKIQIKDFENSYNQMITKIKEGNPQISIISIVPSSLAKDSTYRNKIIEIANNNKILIADTKAAFDVSQSKEKDLEKDGIPTDLGYQIYTKTIEDVISKQVK